MKFKEYFNSLVSKRKNHTPSSSTSTTKSHSKSLNIKNHQESLPTTTDSHYDICSYEDINNIVPDDHYSRTQILLARHAELVNNIVGSRTPTENQFSSCSQCRISYHPAPIIPPPPPLPPKLTLEHQTSYSNRNYSSTLATCSPRRECQQQPYQHQQHQLYHQNPHVSSQYSTPNPNVMSSSSSSLWTTATTSLSKKQRSKIRTNPWIGNNSMNNRQSTFIESPNVFYNHHHHQEISSSIAPLSQPEYEIYDPTYRTSPPGLIHSESFPQTISNGNIHLINSPPPPPPIPAPTSSVILHQSDSGHGFSLSSSRVINSSSSSSPPSSSSSPSSSSPANTSGDGILSNSKPQYRQKKLKKKISSTSPSSLIKKNSNSNTNPEQHCYSNTISSDSGSLTRRKKAHQTSPSATVQYRYQRPSNITKANSPIKSSMDRIHQKHHSHSSSSRSIDDHFSLEFEEILENERSYKQLTTNLRSPTSISPRKSPFILPLDDTNIKLSSPPLVFSPTLTKTNSRAILKHIEEIENEIRLIKNLDLNHNDDDDNDDEQYVLSPHAYPEDDIDLVDDNDDNNNYNHNFIEDDDDDEQQEEDKQIKDERNAIYDQVDQWVEKCLNTNTSPTLLHNECDHLTNTIKDYVVCVYSNDEQQNTPVSPPKVLSSSSPPPPASSEQPTKLMTAIYLSSISVVRTAKRTSSFIDKPLKLENIPTVTDQLKSIHECPF